MILPSHINVFRYVVVKGDTLNIHTLFTTFHLILYFALFFSFMLFYFFILPAFVSLFLSLWFCSTFPLHCFSFIRSICCCMRDTHYKNRSDSSSVDVFGTKHASDSGESTTSSLCTHLYLAAKKQTETAACQT